MHITFTNYKLKLKEKHTNEIILMNYEIIMRYKTYRSQAKQSDFLSLLPQQDQ